MVGMWSRTGTLPVIKRMAARKPCGPKRGMNESKGGIFTSVATGWKPVLLAILLSQVSLAAEGLQIGVARTDITPPIGHVMGGYSARKGGSVGVHDPLYATAVVMKSRGESVALVSLDLRSFPSNRVVQTLREEHGIAHTLLSSTHTHSGPLTWEDKT